MSTKDGFTAEEKAAVKQAAAERRRTAAGKNTEQDVLDAIAAMDEGDRAIAEGLHALVKRVAPELTSRTWYGFPAYARDAKGKEIVFFYQFAGKFKTRYGTLGFNDNAQLDEGTLWPAAYAITTWDEATEQQVEQLVRRAIG
ncbi:hypothetical protein [Luteococcus peritonei]|uniref:DUF1801 domain-containing protein n=1 Tax=Luteococcus peritonei TaxID=88874 RepID=A0ABW4RSX1_9ACTN